jgi:hypothetical protein
MVRRGPFPPHSGVALVMTRPLLRRTAGGRRCFVQGRNSKAAVEGSRAKWADPPLQEGRAGRPGLWPFDNDHDAYFDDDVKQLPSVKTAYTSVPQYTRPSLAVMFCLIHAGRIFFWRAHGATADRGKRQRKRADGGWRKTPAFAWCGATINPHRTRCRRMPSNLLQSSGTSARRMPL